MGFLSFIGDALGFISGSNSAKVAKDTTRETNETNYAIAAEQRNWSERMINEQNQYNSPIAQKQRFEEAGMNPYMAMSAGNISAGNQTELPSYQRAEMQNPAGIIAQASFQDGQLRLQSFQSAVMAAGQVVESMSKLADRDKTLLDNKFFRDNYENAIEQSNQQTISLRINNLKDQIESDRAKFELNLREKFGVPTENANLNLLRQEYWNKVADEDLTRSQEHLTQQQWFTERKKLDVMASEIALNWAKKTLTDEQFQNEKLRNEIVSAAKQYIVDGYKYDTQLSELEYKDYNMSWQMRSDYAQDERNLYLANMQRAMEKAINDKDWDAVNRYADFINKALQGAGEVADMADRKPPRARAKRARTTRGYYDKDGNYRESHQMTEYDYEDE